MRVLLSRLAAFIGRAPQGTPEPGHRGLPDGARRRIARVAEDMSGSHEARRAGQPERP